jgi:general secretion pathway protein J
MTGRPGRRCAATQGFTLVEMLVALLVFALLAAAGIAVLRISVQSQGAVRARLDELAAARRVDALLRADLAQAVPRPTRNAAGVMEPAFAGGPDGFTLVRGGWDNLDDAPRAELQRVEYRLAGTRLERRVWPMLDGAAPLAAEPVIADARAIRLRYRSRDGWRDRWDPLARDALPLAVDLVVTGPGGAETRQAYLVGAGL